MREKFKTVDEYINSFSAEVKDILIKIKETIQKVIPENELVISYNIACFKKDGKYVIYFAGFENHVAVYPIHPEEVPFSKELEPYISGKATLKFPINKPIPYNLITKVAKFKLENLK